MEPSAPTTKSASSSALTACGERDAGTVGVEVVHFDVLDLEPQVATGVQPRGDEVLHDLLLAVDDDRAAGQLGEVDAVPRAVETQLGALVRHALGVHPLADAGLAQRFGGAVLEHAGAHARLDVRAVAPLEHDRLDALQVQQLGQQQPGRPGADDRHLGPHLSSLLHACPARAYASAERKGDVGGRTDA